VVLLEVDLGVIAYLGIGNCRIADGGGLASPELFGLPIKKKIELSGARYIVEQQALIPGGYASKDKSMTILYQEAWYQNSIKAEQRVRYYMFYRRGP
jgi:hypothetical protein